MDTWLDGLAGSLSTRTLRRVHAILKRAIRQAQAQAQARDMVMRNVAELVRTPKGMAGRPSRGAHARAGSGRARGGQVIATARLRELSLLTGVRTEEAGALRWDHVVGWVDDEEWRPVVKAGFEHDRFAIYVWRSVRAGGDTKT